MMVNGICAKYSHLHELLSFALGLFLSVIGYACIVGNGGHHFHNSPTLTVHAAAPAPK